jgi:hypothetical protein
MMKSVLALFLALLAVGDAFYTQQPAFARPALTTQHMTVLSYNGKKKDFKEGSPLKNAVASLGVKVKYSCKK